MTTTATAAGNQIVVRFRDHRILKGTTADFAPDRPQFHVQVVGDGSAPVKISVADLKAVYFVRTYAGNSAHVKQDDVDSASGQGRRVEITFNDGEVMGGFTMGYNRAKPGFFVIPTDKDGNNLRVFVVHGAVKSLRWP